MNKKKIVALLMLNFISLSYAADNGKEETAFSGQKDIVSSFYDAQSFAENVLLLKKPTKSKLNSAAHRLESILRSEQFSPISEQAGHGYHMLSKLYKRMKNRPEQERALQHGFFAGNRICQIKLAEFYINQRAYNQADYILNCPIRAYQEQMTTNRSKEVNTKQESKSPFPWKPAVK